jgi:aryl-alcohol dehydrogenase-like predicted oxidoreductase
VRHRSIPLFTSKPVPVVGVGAMPLSESAADGSLRALEDSVAVLHHAFDLGLTLVDTADIYAPDAARFGHNERVVGEAVRSWSGGRDALVVVTKVGVTRTVGDDGADRWGRDGSRDYLLGAAEASVQRLGFVPDVIINHRVNREQQPYADTVRGMLAVREAGFAPAVGIGNVHLDECLTAWELSEGTIAAVENERSPRFRDDGDVLTWASEHGVAYLPWSPLGGGDDARSLATLHPEFAAVAAAAGARSGRDVTAQQVALAWLIASGPSVVPIPGFTRAATATASAAAADLELTADELALLDASPAAGISVFPDDED